MTPNPTVSSLTLRGLSAAFGAIAALRSGLYERGWLARVRLDRPTVAVGALSVGGTGKTPTTVMLADILLARGLRPAILSRGYRRRSRGPLLVSSGDGRGPGESPRRTGDEPAWMAAVLPEVPVAVATRREEAASKVLACTDRIDLFLLDDAYQHLRLDRHVNFLVVDADAPFWNDRPLPLGRLRERPAAARRADAFLIAGSRVDDARSTLGELHPGVPVFEMRAEPVAAWELDTYRTHVLAGEASMPSPTDPDRWPSPVYAFAGIARPDRFWRSVERATDDLVGHHAFPDHHDYDAAELRGVARRAREAGAEALLTTEKDAVRLPSVPEVDDLILVVRHRLRPVDEGRIGDWLGGRLAAISRRDGAPGSPDPGHGGEQPRDRG